MRPRCLLSHGDRDRHARVFASTLTFVLVLGGALLAARPADASVEDCVPTLMINAASYESCDTMMVLAPGNDTRANLLLLLLDRDMPAPSFPPATPPPKPLGADAVPRLYWQDIRDRFFEPEPRVGRFAAGEGSRCRSDSTGVAAFEAAVNAAPDLTASERAALLEQRKGIAPRCDGGDKQAEGPVPPETPVPSIRSSAGHAFATYVRGAQAFYEGHYKTAVERFSKLHGNANAWIADVADYMLARTALNRMQVGAFDDYGAFVGHDHVDQTAAARAEQSLDAYLRDHPKGAYVKSARGLLRRVYWLTGRGEKLAAAYAALIAMPSADRGIDDATLAEEIASKLLPDLKPTATRDPILLAAFDLMAMRPPHPSARDGTTPPDTRHIDLEAQRDAFASTPRLFEHLVATQAYYLDHDPTKVMKLLPDDTHRHGGDHLWFSRQILRGLALEAKRDRNTRAFWKELFPNAVRPLDGLVVQLALAMHDERSGTLADIFAKDSIVTSPKFRQILLTNNAGAALLRREAKDAAVSDHERRIALGTLLWKELTRGHAADFVADLALVPADAPIETNEERVFATRIFTHPAPGDLACPPPRTTAAQLAEDAEATRARLCLAEFVRVNSLDQTGLDTRPNGYELGGGRTGFPGNPYARGDTYKSIIADRAAPAQDRAFALYRAVKCYEPANLNGCGGKDVPKARRKAWYQALKREYPKSRWAEELTLWW